MEIFEICNCNNNAGKTSTKGNKGNGTQCRQWRLQQQKKTKKKNKKEVEMKREKNSNFPSIINNVKRHGWGKNMHGPLTLRGARTENGTRCLLRGRQRRRHLGGLDTRPTYGYWLHTNTYMYLGMCVCVCVCDCHFESWARFATKKKVKNFASSCVCVAPSVCVCVWVCRSRGWSKGKH